MIGLRHAGPALCAILSISILAAGRYPVRGQEQAPVAAQPPSASCKQHSEFRVVIDVGHTVAVPGAMSARGVPEYAFNRQLAQDVDQALVAAGFDQTMLLEAQSVDDDEAIQQLKERATALVDDRRLWDGHR